MTDCYGDGTVYRGVRSKDSEIKMIEEADYDVVIATLQQAIELREKINASNAEWNIMDHFRCEQIAKLEKAINFWKTQQRKPLDDDEINKAFEIARCFPGYELAGYRRRCFKDGVRFAEKYHGITPAEQNPEQDPEPVKEVMHTLLGTNR